MPIWRFWWKPEESTEFAWLTKQYALSPKLPLEFYLDVGKHETIAWWGHPNLYSIGRLILSPEFEAKIGSKELENRRKILSG
jgi:hypothetical protein